MELRIEDLPFEEREPLALLGIVRGRTEPDLEFAGFGFATLSEVALAGASGPGTVVRDALVLALHTPDEPDEGENGLDVELEISLGDEPDAQVVSILVPLQRFLEERAGEVVGDARDVVLALCNPRDLRPVPPCWLVGTRRLHFATGDVIAWLDIEDDGRERVRLQAERWHTMSAEPEARPC